MFVGIDVAKAELVVSVLPNLERFTVANDERGARRRAVHAPRPVSAHPQADDLHGGGPPGMRPVGRR